MFSFSNCFSIIFCFRFFFKIFVKSFLLNFLGHLQPLVGRRRLSHNGHRSSSSTGLTVAAEPRGHTNDLEGASGLLSASPGRRGGWVRGFRRWWRQPAAVRDEGRWPPGTQEGASCLVFDSAATIADPSGVSSSRGLDGVGVNRFCSPSSVPCPWWLAPLVSKGRDTHATSHHQHRWEPRTRPPRLLGPPVGAMAIGHGTTRGG
jgi:hypothetical protein